MPHDGRYELIVGEPKPGTELHDLKFTITGTLYCSFMDPHQGVLEDCHTYSPSIITIELSGEAFDYRALPLESDDGSWIVEVQADRAGAATVTVTGKNPRRQGDQKKTIDFNIVIPSPKITIEKPIKDGEYESSEQLDVTAIIDDCKSSGPVECHLNGARQTDLIRDPKTERWGTKLALPLEVPREHQVEIRTSCAYVANPVRAEVKFRVKDTNGPILIVEKPKEEEVFLCQNKPFKLDVVGTVADLQSGCKDDDCLTYSSIWIEGIESGS